MELLTNDEALAKRSHSASRSGPCVRTDRLQARRQHCCTVERALLPITRLHERFTRLLYCCTVVLCCCTVNRALPATKMWLPRPCVVLDDLDALVCSSHVYIKTSRGRNTSQRPKTPPSSAQRSTYIIYTCTLWYTHTP